MNNPFPQPFLNLERAAELLKMELNWETIPDLRTPGVPVFQGYSTPCSGIRFKVHKLTSGAYFSAISV